MGVNYYAEIDKCSKCKRPAASVHLGKSSGGWKFNFQYNQGIYYKNVEEMKVWLRDKTIVNEYGDIISDDEFWALVENKQRGQLDHKEEYPEDIHSFHVGNYNFTDCEFS